MTTHLKGPTPPMFDGDGSPVRCLIDDYFVDEMIGEGGMGEVYKVHLYGGGGDDLDINTPLALKLLRSELCGDPAITARFFNEAKIVRQIGHPNIAAIHVAGTHVSGRCYLVVELLEGSILDELLDAGRMLSPRLAVSIARQIVSALVAAHGKGVIHRDLKPDNVFLVTEGGRQHVVKLIDFGIAKWTTPPPGVTGISKTRTGMILGTPGYMSPEQANGDSIDARSDIYALGVMLYRMLGGSLPFPGEAFAQIFRRQLTEEAQSLIGRGVNIPAEINRLVLSMLALNPEDRPKSMVEVEARLKEVPGNSLANEVDRTRVKPVLDIATPTPTRAAPRHTAPVVVRPSALMPAATPEPAPRTTSARRVTLNTGGPRRVARPSRQFPMWAVVVLVLGAIAGVGGALYYFGRADNKPATTTAAETAKETTAVSPPKAAPAKKSRHKK